MTLVQRIREYKDGGRKCSITYDIELKILQDIEAELIAERVTKGKSFSRERIRKQAFNYMNEIARFFDHVRDIRAHLTPSNRSLHDRLEDDLYQS